MMLFTHLLVGLLVGLGVSTIGGDPVVLPSVLAAGLAGGLLPDLDMFADHRRTLHAPILYGVLGIPLLLAGVVADVTLALLVGAALVAAWLHSVMDAVGSARELRPWDRTSEEAVYNHVLDRWHAPWRLVYDGSPGDLVLCTGLAILVAAGHPTTAPLAVALWVPAAVYALCRRPLAARIPAEFESLSPYLKARVRTLGGRLRRLAVGKQGG